jgi:hypothetical protein
VKTTTSSAEFRLVAACCIWPPSEKRDNAVRRAAAAQIDWPKFLAAVRRQRAAGLVRNGLTRAGIVIPDEAMGTLSRLADETARSALQLASEAVRLQTTFDAAGIPAVFLKGSALAMLAYGNLAIKHAWDIDLLVAPRDLRLVGELLGKAGFARILPPADFAEKRLDAWFDFAREAIFRHRTRGTVLELHWRLSDNRAQLAGVTADTRSLPVTISPGQVLRTLPEDDLFTYLCLHGAYHGWSRLKWLADIAAWLSAMPQGAIERLYAAACGRNAGRAAAQTLLLCQELLALDVSPALAESMRRDRAIRWLVAVAHDAMVGDSMDHSLEEPLGSFKVQMSHFLLAPGVGHWLRELHSKSIGWDDFRRYALPRPLYFLYPVLRMPSWLWRRAAYLMSPRHN